MQPSGGRQVNSQDTQNIGVGHNKSQATRRPRPVSQSCEEPANYSRTSPFDGGGGMTVHTVVRAHPDRGGIVKVVRKSSSILVPFPPGVGAFTAAGPRAVATSQAVTDAPAAWGNLLVPSSTLGHHARQGSSKQRSRRFLRRR